MVLEVECSQLAARKTLEGEMLTAKKWILVIDRHVVADNILSFLSALGMLFSAYYCFRIEYNEGAPATLDFFQRCFLMINPDKGSKLKKGYGTHPKVLSLIQNVSDFEWAL
ncbi:hypothetical protein BSL78_09958 [Apostichopus japonicus]|uniref:Uncharacterized protein n=1 Tax=Stichopus japonicus TaxID=307972 RepID=A0A2G8KYP0_STIJA|nr:hypothetical protein BSL78_09958 [Apostichopus japonicus]